MVSLSLLQRMRIMKKKALFKSVVTGNFKRFFRITSIYLGISGVIKMWLKAVDENCNSKTPYGRNQKTASDRSSIPWVYVDSACCRRLLGEIIGLSSDQSLENILFCEPRLPECPNKHGHRDFGSCSPSKCHFSKF